MYSAELGLCSIGVLTAFRFLSPLFLDDETADLSLNVEEEDWSLWGLEEYLVCLPIVFGAVGGIIVGQVTAHVGGVRKG